MSDCNEWTIREWIEKTNVDPRCPFFNESIPCPVRKQLFEEGYRQGEKIWRMAAEMASDGVGFFLQEEDNALEFDLLMNDVYGFATADLDHVTFDEVPAVHAIWKKYGWAGLVRWSSEKRGYEPMPETQKKVLEEISRIDAEAKNDAGK